MGYNYRHNQEKDGVITMYLPSIELIERTVLWSCAWYVCLDLYKHKLPHALRVWRRLNKEKRDAKRGAIRKSVKS